MGYWGWRPLIFSLFISVWVVGCSMTQQAAPITSPTLYPPITLTVRSRTTLTPTTAQVTHSVTTPRPSATPEASPTPQLYIVKAGDTLLGIALNLGVDLDALRAANSGIDPYALQIGQTLIVPSAQANPLTLVALPTPTPLALVLPPPTCYPARTGGTLCLGLVENPFDQTVQNVRLSIQLMGDNGAFLSSQETDVAQFIVPPKGLAPYHVQFADAGSSAAGASAVLLSAEFLPQGDASFLQLEVQDDHGVSVDQQYVVTAELYNAATSAAESVRVVVTLFDADGGVIGYRVMMLETPLPSGERLPIRAVILSVNNAVPTRYTIYAEGRAGKS